jgi:hypothetical protein
MKAEVIATYPELDKEKHAYVDSLIWVSPSKYLSFSWHRYAFLKGSKLKGNSLTTGVHSKAKGSFTSLSQIKMEKKDTYHHSYSRRP